MSDDFNPLSSNAQFAKIIERLDQQDRLKQAMHEENQRVLRSILGEQKLTNGRVTRLEQFKRDMVKICAGISLAVAIICKIGFALWAR